MNEPRRTVGDEVLEDLTTLLQEGKISSVTSPLRSVSSPARVAQNMMQGAGKTIAEQKETIARLEQERKQGALTVLLDPKEIAPSKFANRHALSLSQDDEEFLQLLQSLRSNEQDQPILVRPSPADAEHGKPYEIAFGHRRHAAALILDQERLPEGWKIKAHIKGLSDLELVEVMDRENTDRKNISPYENGLHFIQCLREGLYEHQADLARRRNISKALVLRYIQIAELPEEILRAFKDPRAIRVAWLQDIRKALSSNEQATLAMAKELAESSQALDPEAVCTALVKGAKPSDGASSKSRHALAEEQIFRLPGSKRVGLSIVPKRGSVRIKWGKGIGLDYQKQFAAALRAFVQEQLRTAPPPDPVHGARKDSAP